MDIQDRLRHAYRKLLSSMFKVMKNITVLDIPVTPYFEHYRYLSVRNIYDGMMDIVNIGMNHGYP